MSDSLSFSLSISISLVQIFCIISTFATFVQCTRTQSNAVELEKLDLQIICIKTHTHMHTHNEQLWKSWSLRNKLTLDFVARIGFSVGFFLSLFLLSLSLFFCVLFWIGSVIGNGLVSYIFAWWLPRKTWVHKKQVDSYELCAMIGLLHTIKLNEKERTDLHVLGISLRISIAFFLSCFSCEFLAMQFSIHSNRNFTN